MLPAGKSTHWKWDQLVALITNQILGFRLLQVCPRPLILDWRSQMNYPCRTWPEPHRRPWVDSSGRWTFFVLKQCPWAKRWRKSVHLWLTLKRPLLQRRSCIEETPDVHLESENTASLLGLFWCLPVYCRFKITNPTLYPNVDYDNFKRKTTVVQLSIVRAMICRR